MKNKNFVLCECERSGSELGDSEHVIAISDCAEHLIRHCQQEYKREVCTLDSIGCPITPDGKSLSMSFNTYYIIRTTSIQII